MSRPPPTVTTAAGWVEGGREILPVPPPEEGVAREKEERQVVEQRRSREEREERESRRDGREDSKEGRIRRRRSDSSHREERERGRRRRSGSRHRSRSRDAGDRKVKEEPGSSRRERRFQEEKVKKEPRDIDLRQPKDEPKAEVKLELAAVAEELAGLVAESGEEVEELARKSRDRAPELGFLQERSCPMYRAYRARVAVLREEKVSVKLEPARKRRSRWGAQETAVLPPPALNQGLGLGASQAPGLGSSRAPGLGFSQAIGLGSSQAPGLALPTQLGGLVVQRPVGLPEGLSPALAAYGQRVFGRTDLSQDQWRQCADQLKMNEMYNELAAKQAKANALKAAGKVKFEYDSDEETEGGTWEHKRRQEEMDRSAAEAAARAAQTEGSTHLGDFLPPEELAKFMEQCKALRSGSAVDRSEYQENRLGQDNLGFKMLQKMGWSEGAGLGSELQGITAPVGKSGAGGDRQGLGTETGELNEDDDEFDTYRKRMMLAYRFRPNPLNNPRRSYY